MSTCLQEGKVYRIRGLKGFAFLLAGYWKKNNKSEKLILYIPPEATNEQIKTAYRRTEERAGRKIDFFSIPPEFYQGKTREEIVAFNKVLDEI